MPEWHQLDSSSTMPQQQEATKKKSLKSNSRSSWFSTGLFACWEIFCLLLSFFNSFFFSFYFRKTISVKQFGTISGPTYRMGLNCLQMLLTLKAPITTAADDKFCDKFSQFSTTIRYDITWESSVSRRFSLNIMAYLLSLKKQQNLQLSSAANYRWRFKG